MDAKTLGTKSADVVDDIVHSMALGFKQAGREAKDHASSAKHAVTTFWGAFNDELAARKLARLVPEVKADNGYYARRERAERRHNEFEGVPGKIDAPRLSETEWANA